MEDYTMALREHRDNLTLISSRSYREATHQARHNPGSFEAEMARTTWRADCAAETVADHYFYDSYTGVKR